MGLGALNPIAFPGFWDRLIVGDVPSPGYCTWSGWARKLELDKKKGKGTKGATSTVSQEPPAEGSFEFFIWDDGSLGTGRNHFEDWENFSALLKHDPSKKEVTALGVFHPALDAIDVRSVICEEIGAPEPKGDGMWSVQCKFSEYLPASAKNITSTATTTTEPNPAGPVDYSTADTADKKADADADGEAKTPPEPVP
jgi:hypothetical protein